MEPHQHHSNSNARGLFPDGTINRSGPHGALYHSPAARDSGAPARRIGLLWAQKYWRRLRRSSLFFCHTICVAQFCNPRKILAPVQDGYCPISHDGNIVDFIIILY